MCCNRHHLAEAFSLCAARASMLVAALKQFALREVFFFFLDWFLERHSTAQKHEASKKFCPPLYCSHMLWPNASSLLLPHIKSALWESCFLLVSQAEVTRSFSFCRYPFHSHLLSLQFNHNSIFVILPVLCTTFRPQSHSLLLSRTCNAAAEPTPSPVYLAPLQTSSLCGPAAAPSGACRLYRTEHRRHQSAELFDGAPWGHRRWAQSPLHLQWSDRTFIATLILHSFVDGWWQRRDNTSCPISGPIGDPPVFVHCPIISRDAPTPILVPVLVPISRLSTGCACKILANTATTIYILYIYMYIKLVTENLLRVVVQLAEHLRNNYKTK